MLILMKQLLSNITITVDMLMKCLALPNQLVKPNKQQAFLASSNPDFRH